MGARPRFEGAGFFRAQRVGAARELGAERGERLVRGADLRLDLGPRVRVAHAPPIERVERHERVDRLADPPGDRLERADRRGEQLGHRRRG